MKLEVLTNQQKLINEREYWRSKSPEDRLDALEFLRMQAGKFLYEYPTRLRRIVTITRRK